MTDNFENALCMKLVYIEIPWKPLRLHKTRSVYDINLKICMLADNTHICNILKFHISLFQISKFKNLIFFPHCGVFFYKFEAQYFQNNWRRKWILTDVFKDLDLDYQNFKNSYEVIIDLRSDLKSTFLLLWTGNDVTRNLNISDQR